MKYDPITGIITRRGIPLPVYFCRKNPFFRIRDKKRKKPVTVMAARLAWTLHHGIEPAPEIMVRIINRSAVHLLAIDNLDLVDRIQHITETQRAALARRYARRREICE